LSEDTLNTPRDSVDEKRKIKLFCGHGPVVEDGIAKMEEYIQHRLQREQQVLEALERAGQAMTAADLVKIIYGPSLDPKLIEAAEKGVILHLEKLEQEGRVKRIDKDRQIYWELTPTKANV